jgi:hypothetical protein
MPVLVRVDKSGATGGGSSAAPIFSSGDYNFLIGGMGESFRGSVGEERETAGSSLRSE